MPTEIPIPTPCNLFEEKTVLVNSSGDCINPATEDKQDDIITGITGGSQKTQIVGATGNVAVVNDLGQLHTVLRGMLDTGNSTIENLIADEVFTGDSVDTADYAAVTLSVHSDVASTVGGLSVQYSSDGSDWHDGENYTIEAGASKFFTPTLQSKYMRVIYTNGAAPTTDFHIHTMLRKTPIKWSSHNIDEAISGEDDAELVKAVLSGEDPNGVFQNVNTTVDGDLTISDNSNGLSIAQGNVSGTSFIHKFGNAPDFDTTDGIITIWDGADDNTVWEKMQYTYSSTADIDSISSSDNGDTQDIEIQGLDTNYDMVTQTITLTGQTPASLTTNLIRVFRLKNVNSSDNAGHVFCYVSGGTVTAGVPQVAADIRAIIQPGNNQTLMSIFTVPAGKTGYVRSWYGAIAGANKTSNYILDLRARPFGQVFQLKHRTSLGDTGTSYVQHAYTEPPVFTEKTDIEMRVALTASGATAASFSSGFDLVMIDN